MFHAQPLQRIGGRVVRVIATVVVSLWVATGCGQGGEEFREEELTEG